MSLPDPSLPPLSVLHIFPDSARLSSGPCNAILQMMACQIAYGMNVKAISPLHRSIPENQRQPIEHLPIAELEANDFDGQIKLIESILADRTVVHFHGIAGWTNRIAAYLRDKRKRYVFTSQGHLHYHSTIHAFKKWVYLNVINRFIRDASGLHFLTQRERNRARLILPGWNKTLLLQPNIVKPPHDKEVVATQKPSLGIPQDAFVFLYLGRIDVKHKGLDLVVKAFGEVARDADAYLLLVGPDFANGREALGMLARDIGQTDRVRFLESQTGAAKWSVLKMADAFVSPSRWEAFSSAQVEAIGSGIPTIVSDQVNAAAEMAASGAALTSQLTVQALAKTMREVMNDERLRKSLSQAGREWVAKTCSPESAAKSFAKFYCDVLSESRQS